jgi:hypothetical protein
MMSETVENSTTNRRPMNSSIVQEQHGGIPQHSQPDHQLQ